MAKHRSFKLEKVIKAADDELLKQYFETWEISVPDSLVFDNGDGFDDFWKGLDEIKRSDIDA